MSSNAWNMPASQGKPDGLSKRRVSHGFLRHGDILERRSRGARDSLNRIAASMKTRPPVDQDLLAVVGPEAIIEAKRRLAMLDAIAYAATRMVAGDWRDHVKDLLKRLGRGLSEENFDLEYRREPRPGTKRSAYSLPAT